MEIAELQEKAAPVLRAHGVAHASVFGSTARGEARPDSDIDLLVRFGKPVGMVAYMQFVDQIEKTLQKKVDVVTEGSLNKFIKPHIMPDLTTIYEG